MPTHIVRCSLFYQASFLRVMYQGNYQFHCAADYRGPNAEGAPTDPRDISVVLDPKSVSIRLGFSAGPFPKDYSLIWDQKGSSPSVFCKVKLFFGVMTCFR